MLALRAVAKRFGDVPALEPVDLDVGEGRVMTLLGPSGCGKTTLLRIVAGFLAADAGAVLLDGRDIGSLPPDRRPFNMVFQSYALFPHLSVAENVAYGLRMAGVSRGDVARRVRDGLELVGLEDRADRPVTELSGGQQQRVALVRAVVNEPRVLLLDEPLGALDLQLRRRLQDELRALQARLGTTFVYVTHDQEEALTLSHDIALMRDGRVVQVGTPQEVYERPATRFVAEFVGAATLVPCEVVEARPARATIRLVGGAVVDVPSYATQAPQPGSPGLAALRPEHLSLTADDHPALAGTLRATVFHGADSRHEVTLDDGTVVAVRAAGQDDATVGDRVGVRVLAGRGALVAPEDSVIAADA